MAMLLYVTAIFLAPIVWILITYWSWLKQTWRANQALKQFDMLAYSRIFGHLFMHPGQTHEGLLQFAEWASTRFPRYLPFYFGPFRPVLILNHPDTIKQMCKSDEPKCTSGGGYALLKPWIGEGLLISSGRKWFRNRRLLTPGFHFEILKPYMNVYNSCAETLMDKFDSCSAQTGNSMDVYTPVGLCTLDIILRCAFSTQRDIQGQGDDDPYVSAVKELSQLIVQRSFNPHLYVTWLYKLTQKGKRFFKLCDYSHRFADDIIRKRREELENDTRRPELENAMETEELENASDEEERKRYVDFLDILLLARDDSGKGLTDSEIRDEVETFMFEGHDTTASGISWILYNLARHPEFQARATYEIDALLSERDSECIQWSDMAEMPYLTMCIKESLRMHPPVYFVSRETTKPFTVDDKTIPPGTVVDISLWNMHHNENVWSDPFTYNPDRFLPDAMALMDPYAFLPFSAGPRNCIGQNFAMNEMKTVVARVLRNFVLSVDEAKPARMLPDVVLRSENGIHIHFQRRNTNKTAQ